MPRTLVDPSLQIVARLREALAESAGSAAGATPAAVAPPAGPESQPALRFEHLRGRHDEDFVGRLRIQFAAMWDRVGRRADRIRRLPDAMLSAEPILRWRLSSSAVRWLAIVLVIGLGWGGWLALRSAPTPAPVPVVVAAASSSAVAKVLVVDVVGPVARPGIVRVPDGSRVVDVIKAAGGMRRGTSPGTVNLARPVVDGEQVVIGSSPGLPVAANPTPGLVDLNTAGLSELDSLPHVGPVLAQRIVDWRDSHGRFASVEELREIAGIGASVFADLVKRVRV